MRAPCCLRERTEGAPAPSPWARRSPTATHLSAALSGRASLTSSPRERSRAALRPRPSPGSSTARLSADCAGARVEELDGAQEVRVRIARALLRRPRLLVIDEPTLGLPMGEREEIIALLSSLAAEGITVLHSTDSETFFLGADRALTIDRGVLRGERRPALAEVIPLRRSA